MEAGLLCHFNDVIIHKAREGYDDGHDIILTELKLALVSRSSFV